MKELQKILYGFFILLIPFASQAQFAEDQVWEFGLWGGGANYSGDIRPSLSNSYKIFRPAGGIFNRINFNPRLSLKTSVNFGIITGRDEYSSNTFEETRNLSFSSNIYDISTQFEFNFFPYILRSKINYFTPYVFVGISGFHFNPKARIDGDVYELQPLGTEGQMFPQFTGREPYKLYQLAVPFGGGFKYNLSGNISIGFEIGYRQTFTDYLDDISTTYVDRRILEAGNNGDIAASLADRSGEVVGEPIGIEDRQRGNSKNNDAYIFTGFSISYTFTKLKCPPPSGSIFNRNK